jgi:hypothetical protein
MEIPPGVIQENACHVLELTDLDNPDGASLEIEGVAPKALRNPSPRTAKWEWAVGFHAGTVELDAMGDGRSFRTTAVLDPDLRKLSRADFELMVFECLEDLEKVFALSRTRLGLDKGDRRPPLARLEFLRSRLPALERAVRRIIAQPHRKLEPITHLVRIQKARGITGLDLARSMRYGPHLHIGDRVLPGMVSSRRKESCVDTSENRSVKAFLVRWTGWLDRATVSFGLDSKGDDAEATGARKIWARRCGQMSARMRRMLSDPFFSEIGNHPSSSEGSAVFRCVGGYQQFGKIRRDMNRGLAAIVGHWLDMPIARTWELYELWVFLRLARACLTSSDGNVTIQGVEDLGGQAILPDTSFGITIRQGLQIVFQRKYREYWKATDHQGSFSREMIPDVAITIGQGEVQSLLVLDAKYRVNQGINDALSSIHTYRDALVEETTTGIRNIVQGAYLVSPHLPPDFRSDWKDEGDVANRVFHPDYRQKFRFGAVTMRPGSTSIADACRILESMAAESGIGLA